MSTWRSQPDWFNGSDKVGMIIPNEKRRFYLCKGRDRKTNDVLVVLPQLLHGVSMASQSNMGGGECARNPESSFWLCRGGNGE